MNRHDKYGELYVELRRRRTKRSRPVPRMVRPMPMLVALGVWDVGGSLYICRDFSEQEIDLLLTVPADGDCPIVFDLAKRVEDLSRAASLDDLPCGYGSLSGPYAKGRCGLSRSGKKIRPINKTASMVAPVDA